MQFPKRKTDHAYKELLRDPVTLRDLTPRQLRKHNTGHYYGFRTGRATTKNQAEAAHFTANFTPGSANEKNYARRIKGINHPEIGPHETVMDLGCGPYPNIQAMGGGTQILVDDLMGFYCSKLEFGKVPGLKIESRAEALPIADDSIDYVYSINMIDHVDDMVDACLEVARVLKSGGKLVLQSYFNSFPLLHTEPGMFDEHFLEHVFLQIFRPVEMQTFALGDPSISKAYNCDIVTGVFQKREDWKRLHAIRTPRQAYNDSYVGIQSLISQAILALDEGDLDLAASHISMVDSGMRPTYETHLALLRMRYHILKGEFGPANSIGKHIRGETRTRRNVRLLLTLERLENRRITSAAAHTAQARDAHSAG